MSEENCKHIKKDGAECRACGFRWVAQYYECTEYLECPRCGTMWGQPDEVEVVEEWEYDDEGDELG